MTKIHSKSNVRVCVNQAIDKGGKLLEYFEDIGTLNSEDKFAKVHQEEMKWTAETESFLRELFDDESLAVQWISPGTERVDETEASLRQQKEALQKKISSARRNGWNRW
ncbi:MAG TPA: hypothetical protein VFD58_14000 [Blastocatellia bacterium]|nr:hypothetical protein [Blastocatellia bacterium]